MTPWRPERERSFALRSSLWLVDRLRAPIAWLGVDYALFRLILEQRFRARTAGAPGPVGTGTALAMLFLALAGLGPGFLALVTRQPLWWMLAGQALWIFTLALLTATHFASVLVDPTDVGVLASRPVDDRTLFATRIAHVLAEVLLLAAASALFPTLLALFVFPPLAVLVAYPLATLCSALGVLGAMTLVIAVALRLAGPGRFQRVVFWGQIGGGMLLIVLPQFVPRLLAGVDLAGFLESRRWLAFVLPPLAELSLYRLLAGTGDRLDVLLAALVLILPLGLGAWTLRAASRSYVAALGDPGTLLVVRARGFAQGFFARLGKRLCSTHEARAAYGLALALSRRDKLFLRSILPMMGMIVVMVLGMAVPRHGRGIDTDMAGVGPYYVLMLGSTTFELSRLSEHAPASEWRRILPVASMSALLEGSAKALLCGTLLPLLVLLAAALVAVVGPLGLPDVALGVPLCAAALTFAAKPFLRTLPFTQGAKSGMSFDRLPRYLAMMLAMGLLIGLHALARMHWLSSSLAALAAVLLFLRGWRGLRHWPARP